jgi:TRAP-type C4-dicarboxylate transport system permease small subunit
VTRLDAAFEAVCRAMLRGAAIAVVAMTVLVALSVVMRYALGSPFAFTEELVALLYLAMVFLTIPMGTLRREHITVSVAVDRAGPAVRRLLAVLAALVMVVFAAWFTMETWAFAAFSRWLEARSDHVGILLWPWMAIMPAVMILSGAISLVHAWRALRGRAHHDGRGTTPAGDGL